MTPRANVCACARNCAGIADRIVRFAEAVFSVSTGASSCKLEAKFSFYYNEVHRR